MTLPVRQFSPKRYARIGGVAYLINIAAGLFGETFVRNTLIVPGNAAASAGNILASSFLWRLGIAGDLIMQVTDVILMVIFYVLLKPVNKNLALLAMLFTMTQTAVLVANKMNLLMPLFLLGGDEYLKVFDTHQLQALAYLSVKTHGYGFGIGLIFFGFECLVTGYLIFKSTFLPRALGIMIQFAGICYLVNSFALILAPAFQEMIFPVDLLLPFVAEFSLCLWLIIKGVDVARWKERSLSAGGH